jgi:site-specific DNA-adenine methylase
VAEEGLPLKSPFPYAGGKSRIASEVWSRLGNTPNYCEPFFGSGAVLLARPMEHEWWRRIETVNDADGLLSNFWRAVQAAPAEVACWADWPVNENDLHARHAWLVGRKDSLQTRLEGDPSFYDARAAGWWVWGICCWIGGSWCNTDGPWVVVGGELVKQARRQESGQTRQMPCLRTGGKGVHRKLPHLGGAGKGIWRQRPDMGKHGMRGVLAAPEDTTHCASWSEHLAATMRQLSDRLRRVRVCCGDWSRVMSPCSTTENGLTGIFLDPPYAHSERRDDLYTTETDCAADVLSWCRQHGANPKLRIALCGYEGEHDVLEGEGWKVFSWQAQGGYGNVSREGNANKHRERIWFSPQCLQLSGSEQPALFTE